MKLTRRDVLSLGFGATAAMLLPARPAMAMGDAIAIYTNGVVPQAASAGSLRLGLPQIIGDARRVPVVLEAVQARRLALFAKGAPSVLLADVRFGPRAGARRFETSVRLGTQDTPERGADAVQDLVLVAEIEPNRFVQLETAVSLSGGGYAN
ncbi:thiosulfate oxidation carrier protein SoxY [Aquimixticola soesokkakensis]|uniref:thiosulfate oxidation carrier protein SoxY n=1 Tax=Aquimixticola soesokkakensis TaxID=1519096 RepID=UPI0013566BA1|nr:thiosulfate oxidation carrier protein SoxY [Aquimixticola soesokkakensis]